MAAIKAADSAAFQLNADEWPSYNGYKPLDIDKPEIRLLHIHYDEANSTLTCHLEHAQLQESLAYYALSYSWGAPSCDLRSIMLDRAEVFLRPSIHEFLLRLCRQFGRLTVWLDVLCIDQSDVAERSRQVSMMADIFSFANGVYAWLGEGNSNTNYAIDVLTGVIEKFGVKDALRRDCLEEVCVRPYFRRVWIVSEVVMAKSVVFFCGTRSCTLAQLFIAVQELRSTSPNLLVSNSAFLHSAEASYDHSLAASDSVQYIERIIIEREAYHNCGRSRKLTDIITNLHEHRCLDPRDRLFGYRGFASDRDDIQVDYAATLINLSFQHILSASLGDHSEKQLSLWRSSRSMRLPFAQYSSSRNLDPAEYLFRQNGIHLSKCMDMLRMMRATELDLENSLQHQVGDKIVVLARVGVGSLGELDLFLPFQRSADPNENVLIRLTSLLSVPRVRVDAVSIGGTTREAATDNTDVEKWNLWHGFELCQNASNLLCASTGRGYLGHDSLLPKDMVIHLSRALLLLLSLINTRRKTPAALLQHFEKIALGELPKQRLCYCTEDPYVPRAPTIEDSGPIVESGSKSVR